jgi:hypothetical protein
MTLEKLRYYCNIDLEEIIKIDGKIKQKEEFYR